MQTVIETPNFIAAARSVSLPPQDRRTIIDMIALDPSMGDLIPGTGGARKIRFRRLGGGKSGGYRVITFFAGPEIPVLLLDIYAKNVRMNLTGAQKSEIKQSASQIKGNKR